MSWGTVATAFVLGGVGGWLIENALFGPRNSNLFGKRLVPFLPVYAFGAAGIAAAAPYLRSVPVLARGGIYAGSLSLLELSACGYDRAMGPPSWDYNGSCIDLPHAAAWGLLGLGAEQLALMGESSPAAQLPPQTTVTTR